MTYGSLFSGIGGIDLGLDRAGLRCLWQVEKDEYCRRVLEKHWPDVKRYGDVTELSGNELQPVDLICGGFPCQDVSHAAAGSRAGIEGTRSGLWFEFCRIVRTLRPRFLFIENVAGVLVYGAMRRVIGELARLGYVGIWRSIRASDFGASHRRKRIFVVAYTLFPRLQDTQQDQLSEAPWPQERGTASELRTAPFRFAPGPTDKRWADIIRKHPDLAPALKPPIRGMADGVPDWLDRTLSNRAKRLARLGNAVVPDKAVWFGQRILQVFGGAR